MLKFLIILLCVFFILRTLSRMFVVSSLDILSKKMRDEMFRQQSATRGNQKPEGHITIDPRTGKEQKRNPDDGDYVDYEEVK